MSIDITSSKSQTQPKQSSLYESKTLLCKNKCGYYGNSIQYDGYCSICFRKLKTSKLSNTTNFKSSFALSSSSFDDTSSLLASSQSFSFDDGLGLGAAANNNKQIWNENANLNKFSSKKDTRKSSTFKLFKRQSHSSILPSNNNNSTNSSSVTPLNLVETVSKVADKAVNLVDQSLQNSILNNLSSTFSNNNENNLIEFYNCLNKLTSSTASNNNNSSSNLIKNINTTATNVNLIEFEEQFRIIFPQLYQDLLKQMKQFVDKFLDAFKRKDQSSANNNKQFEVVQEFYKKIYKYIQTSASIKTYLDKLNNIMLQQNNTSNSNLNTNDSSSSSNNQSLDTSNLSQNLSQASDDVDKLYEAIMIMIESFINNSIYDFVFPSIMTEFEEQDMSLQKRIRDFYWITNEMIGTCIDENSIFYRDFYEEALNYIVEMDSKRTAYEKMLCITECSKNIYKAINISASVLRDISEAVANTNTSSPSGTPTTGEAKSILNGSEIDLLNEPELAVAASVNHKKKTNSSNKNNSLASADDYLPAFIYIVLKTNPTMLYSNINFITRFAFEKRILQGEHAYHFCSLNAIISHIENLNAEHLNMSQEEFENYCNGLVDINSSSNALKTIQSNLKILSELKDKQKILKQETLKLQADINTFRKTMQAKFDACLFKNKDQYTKSINGFKKNFLDDNEDLIVLNQVNGLSEPLKPSSLNLTENLSNSVSSEVTNSTNQIDTNSISLINSNTDNASN